MNQNKLMKVFIRESQVHLESIQSDLLELQKNIHAIDSDVLHSVFRAIHSIKGASGFYQFQKISELAHTMETLLSQVRYKKIPASPGLMDALLVGANLLNTMFNDIGKSDRHDIQKEMAQLTEYLKKTDKPVGMVKIRENHEQGREARSFKIPEEKLADLLKAGQSLYTLQVFLKKDLAHKEKTPFDVIHAISRNGEFIESMLDIDAIQGLADCLDQDLSFILLFATATDIALISGSLDIPENRILSIDLTEQREKYGLEPLNDLNPEKDTLFLMPKTDLVASQIETLRDSFLNKLKAHPDVSKVVFKADHIETVDSLGVNLIIGIYRQVKASSKTFEITGAGEKFLKVARFFQFPALFSIKEKEPAK